MSEVFFAFLVILFLLAVFVRQDFVFTVIYLFAGAYLLGGWWMRRAHAALNFRRILKNRAFLYEEIPVRLEIENSGFLPVLWLHLQESLPVELMAGRPNSSALSLGPFGKTRMEYTLLARKRGYYPIGPLFAQSGDVLGLHPDQSREFSVSYLTIYPKIIPLITLNLPSRSPLGTLRHHQPIFEDPTRVLNKRDYIAGDSLRRVDWKASAVAGRLQVKQFEPSITLETVIFLGLSHSDYAPRSRFEAAELAIVVSASVANWITSQKQSVGLMTNGVDPLEAKQAGEPPVDPAWIPPRKGRLHLMRILDLLARIETGQTQPVMEILRDSTVNLSWGTTVVLVTGQANETLFDVLFQVCRAGMNPALVMVGPIPNRAEIRQRAGYFKIPVFFMEKENDLDVWRR